MNLIFITPQRYREIAGEGDKRSLAELQELATDETLCMNCRAHVWRLAGAGLCFSCTTGEADGSEDYEIGAPYL